MEVREDLAHQALSLFPHQWAFSTHGEPWPQRTPDSSSYLLGHQRKELHFSSSTFRRFKDSDCFSWGHRSCLGPVTVALKEDNTMGLNWKTICRRCCGIVTWLSGEDATSEQIKTQDASYTERPMEYLGHTNSKSITCYLSATQIALGFSTVNSAAFVKLKDLVGANQGPYFSITAWLNLEEVQSSL